MTSTGLTLAGLAIAAAVLWLNLRPWWRAGREPKQLVPFGTGFALGALSTVCAGGMLGWLAGCSAGVANTAGSKATKAVTGTTPQGAITTGDLGQLTPEGAVVVFLITVGVVIAWRAAGKLDKRRMAGGLFCGATLCLTAGVAGALTWLPDGINQLGEVLRSGVSGAGIL